VTVRRVPAEFESIQAAVNASGPGDTIQVAGGIYAESVTIGEGKDRLSIIGPGAGNAILQGQGSGIGIIISRSGSVTIEGFTVTGFDTGIQIFTSDNTIREVAVTRCVQDGILVSSGARNVFFRVTGSHNGENGIQVDGSNNYVIDGEFNDNGDDGIDLNGLFNVAIGNRASGNDSGIIVEGGGAVVIGNRLAGNVEGIVLRSAGNLVHGNAITRNSRLGVLYLDDVASLVLGNALTGNQGHGVQAIRASGFAVIGNKAVSNGQDAIALESGAAAGVLEDNQVRESGQAGIRLAPETVGGLVRRNRLQGNTPDISALPPADLRNVFDENRCGTSRPPGLCGCDG